MRPEDEYWICLSCGTEVKGRDSKSKHEKESHSGRKVSWDENSP